jgi:hypothetical protein
MSAWRRCVGGVGGFLLLMGLANCAITEGGPARLYTVADEVDQAKLMLPDLLNQYNSLTLSTDLRSEGLRVYYRNEYIARRMYIIDVEYSAYEAHLTSGRQIFGFGADTVSQALNVAGAVTTSGATSRVLNGLAGGVTAVDGYYDKDLVIAKSLQIIEADMRAQRDTVAQTILIRRSDSSSAYPLSAALSDLEDYYRAGTFNSGLIQATGQAANAENNAAAIKAVIVQGGTYNPSDPTVKLVTNYLAAGPKRAARMTLLTNCLYSAGYRNSSGGPASPVEFWTGSNFVTQRNVMIACAAANGDPMK